jgi:hypothetical protein
LSPDSPLPPCHGLTCPLGCNTAQNRCNRVKPSNFSASSFFDTVSGKVTLSGTSAAINTETGLVKSGSQQIRPAGSPGKTINGVHWQVVSQPSGPSIGVFGVEELNIPKGAVVTVTGKHALAIYSTGDVTISGTLAAPAKGLDPGPGGYAGGLTNGADGAPCSGGEGLGGGNSGSYSNGGGGGGHKAEGGTGGKHDSSTATKVGAGGGTVGSAVLTPLRGGCGGGAGGGPDTYIQTGDGGYGGGGGGAIQIVANGTLTVTGVVTAPGAGGEGAHYGSGGGGGGAGGAVLLEAVTISVTGAGILAVNGGGGGAGTTGPSVADAPDGQDGTSTTSRAGGGAGGDAGGDGGRGGARYVETGEDGGDQTDGGGGGGAAGRVRCNAPTTSIGSSNASPKPSLSTTIGTW